MRHFVVLIFCLFPFVLSFSNSSNITIPSQNITDSSQNTSFSENITSTPNVRCPFTLRAPPHRRCIDCSFCKYENENEGTCCDAASEDGIQMALEIFGDTYWNCRITVMKYSECGKCSPDAHRYVGNKTTSATLSTGVLLNFTKEYVANEVMNHVFNMMYGIRVCKRQCTYIWNQCQTALTTTEGAIFNSNITFEEFCSNSPEENNEEGIWCYSDVGRVCFSQIIIILAILILIYL